MLLYPVYNKPTKNSDVCLALSDIVEIFKYDVNQ